MLNNEEFMSYRLLELVAARVPYGIDAGVRLRTRLDKFIDVFGTENRRVRVMVIHQSHFRQVYDPSKRVSCPNDGFLRCDTQVAGVDDPS